MPQNALLSRLGTSVTQRLVPAVFAPAVLALLPLQLVSEAQEQAPVSPAAAGGGRGVGRGPRGGRASPPTLKPSALCALPAETTAPKAKHQNWKAARTAWGHPDLEGVWTSDDMRGIPTSRPAAQVDREFLTPEEFARRAGGDESSRDRAVNQETFLRNEFGVRPFGYTSFVIDPPNEQIPAITAAAAARQKAKAR
jgi:hypothetical protein